MAGNVTAGSIFNAPYPMTYFPQIAVGEGWSTLFSVNNIGATEATAELFLIDRQGDPLTVYSQGFDSTGPFVNPDPASSYTLTIPSGGTVFLSATGSQNEVQTGWARLESEGGSLTALAIYDYGIGAGTLCRMSVLQSQSLQHATIPVDVDLSEGKKMAYAIANPGLQAISIRLALVGSDGTVWNDDVTITLGPGEQTSRYLFQDMPMEEFKGSLVLRAQNGESFVAVALSEKQGLFTAVPVIAGKAPGVPD